LLYRAVADCATSKLKEVARSRFTILYVSKGRVAVGVEAIIRAGFGVYSNVSRAF
jgi:hypothetical protein